MTSEQMCWQEYILARCIPEPNSGCWLWEKRLMKNGYGRACLPAFPGRSPGQQHLAHRASYAAFKGDPGELCVLHACDLPCCVNPSHLFLGTHADNTADMVRKGRSPSIGQRGSKHHKAKLSEDQVRAARRRVAAGETQKSVAEDLGVSRSAVGFIVSGKHWKHLDG